MAVRNVNAAEFTSTIEQNDIVIADFWADWCAPCRQFGPIFEDVSEQHPDISFIKIDTQAERGLSAEANIVSIPTLMIFREQVMVFSQPGAVSADILNNLITAVRSIDMADIHRKLSKEKAADVTEAEI